MDNIGFFTAYIGKYNEYNSNITGEVFVEYELNTTHTMESNLSCESINDKYAVPELSPSIESMVEHWNRYTIPYEQKYKRNCRTHIITAETNIYSRLRKFMTNNNR